MFEYSETLKYLVCLLSVLIIFGVVVELTRL